MLCRASRRDLDVEFVAQIGDSAQPPRKGALYDRVRRHADFPAVLALPAPAAAALAGSRMPLAARVKAVPMAPCWATLVAFDGALPGVPDAGFTPDPMLRWFARNGSKPGREAREAWVLHASPDWSRVEFDQNAQTCSAHAERFS